MAPPSTLLSRLLAAFKHQIFTACGSYLKQVCPPYYMLYAPQWNMTTCFFALLWHHELANLCHCTCYSRAKSWRLEFKRLYYHTPAVLSEEKKEHKDEVLHVSFSHDGTMFATCSKDGFFKVGMKMTYLFIYLFIYNFFLGEPAWSCDLITHIFIIWKHIL